MTPVRILYAVVFSAVAVAVTIISYILFVVIDSVPGRAFRNSSRSMEPTLMAGDRIMVHLLRDGSAVKVGDLVAVRFPPDPSKQFLKRIVGVPGDTLAMVSGTLYRNSKRIVEPYAWREEPTIDPVSSDFQWQRSYLVGAAARDTAAYIGSRNTWGPIAIPQRQFFVLGDNRDNSLDSRYFGWISADEILGTVRRVYFSRDSLGHVRWSRLTLRPH